MKSLSAIVRGSGLFCCFVLAAHFAAAETITVEVHDLLKTPDQDLVRDWSVSLSCEATASVTYELKQEIRGSLKPAEMINFRKTKNIPSPVCIRITENLRKRGVKSLFRQEHKSPDTGRSFCHIFGSFDGHHFDMVVYVERANLAPTRAIRDGLLQFAHRNDITEPDKKSITKTDGDSEPPQRITMAELLKHPAKYQGKRVSFVAFGAWGGGRDDMGIAVNEAARQDYEHQVAWGSPSTLSRERTQFVDNEWVRVEDIFLKSPSGDNFWFGELARITKVADPLLANRDEC